LVQNSRLSRIGSQTEESAAQEVAKLICMMPISTGMGQVLTDLGIAVDHQAISDPGKSVSAKGESSFHRAAGAKPSRLSTESPCTTGWLIS